MNQEKFSKLGVDRFHRAIGLDLRRRLKAAFKEMVGPRDKSSDQEIMLIIFGDAAKIFNRKIDYLYSERTRAEGFIFVTLDFPKVTGPEQLDCKQLGEVLERVYRCVIEEDKRRGPVPRTDGLFLTLAL